jgi:hypothetical protein
MWNGTVWHQLSPATIPPGMICQGAYDPARQRVVVYGTPPTQSTSTWEWTGTDWEFASSGSPPDRSDLSLGFHTARGRTVQFGGTRNNTSLDETWEWDGASWDQRLPATSPAPRTSAAIAYDAVHGQLIIFGGSPASNDTWAYTFSSTGSPPEACKLAAADTDSDGLAGCADPDCWGRCRPFSPPGTTCSALLPRCGDAVCSPVEDSLICPADCP